MDQRRLSWQAPLAVVAIFAAMVAAYVGAYLTTGSPLYNSIGKRSLAARVYPSQVHSVFFRPASSVESLIRGNDVVLTWGESKSPIWFDSPD